jgi:pimeloyl-ACP methyl ester carboxylesterase
VDFRQFEGANGVRLAADVYGTSGNPSIICFPGAGQTRHAWRRTVLGLAEIGYQAVSVDLRGHGGSDWAADSDYSIDAFAADVCAVTRALPGYPPVLLGASIGGIAAAIAVGEAGARLASGLILVDVVPQMGAAGLQRIRAFMSVGQSGFASLEEAAVAVSDYLPARRPRQSAESLKRNLRIGVDGRWYWHWDPAFHAGSKERAEKGMFARMAAAAQRIQIPVLIVSGARSEVVDREGVEQLRQLLPQARWIEVAGASHMVAGEENDAFNEAVCGFARELSTALAAPTP